MLIYTFVNIIIIFFGFLSEYDKSRKTKKNKILNEKIESTDILFILPSFLLLFIISSFRGGFTTDYNNYANLFRYYNQFELFELLRMDIPQELGYVFLNAVIGIFTTNEIYLFIVTSFIILYCFYSQLRKYSSYIWLSVLMFVVMGGFYTSFNIMRQILAVSIIFIGSKYLFERKMIKYSLVVLTAALFHSTAIIMIVFYFLLNYRFTIKYILIIIFMSIVTILYMENIINYIQILFYSEYTVDTYGMTGFKYTNVVLPIAILIFTVSHYKKIDLNDNISKISLNAVIFYSFFSILGLKVMMIERLAYFFAPYVLLVLPLIISRIKSNELRTIYLVLAVVILISYNYVVLSGTGYDPYYFIWEGE